jgi:hypothetical protein
MDLVNQPLKQARKLDDMNYHRKNPRGGFDVSMDDNTGS